MSAATASGSWWGRVLGRRRVLGGGQLTGPHGRSPERWDFRTSRCCTARKNDEHHPAAGPWEACPSPARAGPAGPFTLSLPSPCRPPVQQVVVEGVLSEWGLVRPQHGACLDAGGRHPGLTWEKPRHRVMPEGCRRPARGGGPGLLPCSGPPPSFRVHLRGPWKGGTPSHRVWL